LYRIVHELPQSLRALGADVSEELESAILQCLEKDPEKRPKRAGHLAEALRRYRGKLHEEEYTRSVMLTASRMVGRPAATAPFIGREKEIAELQRRLHGAVSGECQFAVIAGEPGIGKSRLVEQLTSLARARKIRVLSGRFVEQDRAFAHQGFCELVQDYFRGKEQGSSAASRPDFSDLAGDLIALFPVLSEIGELRAAATDSGQQGTGKAEDKIAIFELIARTLTRIAQGKPLVLVLEELHGAEQSVEALQYIVRRLAPTPTLIVGTYRQTEVDKRHPLAKMLESFRGDSRFVALTLGPLSASDHRAFVETATGGGKISDALAARLFDATEGNPLFTKELVRSLLDSGSIARDDTGVLNLAGGTGISPGALPETIQQAVEARIDRLPEELREVLSVASILGRSFEDRDLAALTEGVEDVEESVEKLLRDGLLEEQQDSRGDRLAFASGIVRDVLYGALSRRKRKLLHRKYADLLEKRHAGRLERVYPELVHHFTQGDVKEKAVEYGLKLAQKSLDAFSAEEAARVAKTALDYVEDEEWPGERALEGEARLLLARAAGMTGHADGALREAEAAVKVFEREKKPERAAAAILFAAEAAWHGRKVEETRRWVERGIQVAKDEETLPKLLSLAATVANLRGEYQRAAAYQAQLERLAPSEKPAADELARGGTLVAAMANPVAVADPALFQTIEEMEVLACVYETLLTTDQEGNLGPLLCDEWRLADGGRSAHLRLRHDVRFSDGGALTAAAVKASLEHAARVRVRGFPAALAAIRGAAEHASGTAAEIAGIRAVSEDRLEIDLVEPLPIFPALLTDLAIAIVRAAPGDGGPATILGTGPFQVSSFAPERILLERNQHAWKEPGPRLDGIEFRTSMSAAAIAYGLREGSIDLGRDLMPQDLDALLREPRFRAGLVETPKKGTYFGVFNSRSPMGGNAALRAALAGITRSRDFVWGALGRFALPATGLIPPGILGHDPGRRRSLLPRESALEALEAAGLAPPISLKVSLHPILQDRFRAVTSALFGIWREVGVEVSVVTSTMAEHLDSQRRSDVDVLIGRWIADYDDPDDFTFSLFHSQNGLYRTYFSSPDVDQLLTEARSEARPAAREALYRRFEQLLLDEAVLLPLFHEVDYRIAGPGMKGLRLRSTPPFVGYTEIAKTVVDEGAAPREWEGGILNVPLAGVVHTIDPAHLTTSDQGEVAPNVFETLTRDMGGARIVPWLASEFRPEKGSTSFRFRLRPGVRFHDGRALTARDVRYSLERVLEKPEGYGRSVLSMIRGARRLIHGETRELEGVHIVSPSELVIELEKPVSFFPVLVSFPGTAVVPEGTGELGESWRKGCVGTGPFRVTAFEPGRRIELQKNPEYWRKGYPKSDGLVFRFGVTPEEIKTDFVSGRLSIASDLLPADAEALRQDS
ncbi:MAG TPA: ABC transporter substrate-binding protein, partial [Thermoanaerobaculia bacterium]|nr:ABC transporter substrate-binding protein [Thermoanaerobaculia bacterium]